MFANVSPIVNVELNGSMIIVGLGKFPPIHVQNCPTVNIGDMCEVSKHADHGV